MELLDVLDENGNYRQKFSKDGYEVQTYLDYYNNGKLIETKKVRHTTYPAQQGIVYKGKPKPKEIVESILWTYNDIVKECMLNQVEISFGDVGIFTYQFFVRKENAAKRNPKTGEIMYIDFPAHYRMNFRQSLKWRKTMREETAKLFEENRKDYEQ